MGIRKQILNWKQIRELVPGKDFIGKEILLRFVKYGNTDLDENYVFYKVLKIDMNNFDFLYSPFRFEIKKKDNSEFFELSVEEWAEL